MTTSRILEFFISAPAHGRKPSHAGKIGRICAVLVLCAGMAVAANPVPFVNQPLVPDAAAPGGPGFTLTVNGTGFVSSSVVLWNGSPRTTQFISQGQLTATIPATDIAKAGTASVTVVSPGPGGGSSLAAFFSVTTPASTVSFAKTTFSSGNGDVQVIAADFNGDGNLDLATSVYYDGTLNIFLGNGDGTFNAGPVYSACLPDAVVRGDFNKDGIPDLAVAARGCSEVMIFLGNGNGTFTESGSYNVGPTGPWGGPYSMALGDFNGDGNIDIATTNESNYVSVLLGNGDGTFQDHVDYDLGVTVYELVVGDFDGDGNLDLAVGSDSAEAPVSILLGSATGAFRMGPVVQLNTEEGVHNLVAADLNGDGKLDLAVTDDLESTVSIALGNGDATFLQGAQYALGVSSSPNNVGLADLRGNGILDLLIPSWSSNVAYLAGNGNGTFQPPIANFSGSGSRGLAIGDFDGDGRLDFAVGNQLGGSMSIFLNAVDRLALTFTPSSLTFGPQPVGTFSPDQLVTVTNTGSESVSFSGINPAGGDFYRINNCPRTLLPNASCTLDVIFTPTATGTRPGQVLVRDNVPGSPQKLALTGTGTGTGKIRLSISPATLDFGSVAVGATSPPQSVAVTNIGTATADFSTPLGPVLEGVNCNEFQITSQCGTALAPNSSCQVSVTFAPKASGTRTSSLLVLQGAHTVSAMLNGIGTP